MKTYDEKTRCVFDRIEQEKSTRHARKNKVIKIVSPVVSFCLIVLLGFAVKQSGAFKTETPRFSPVDSAGGNGDNTPTADHYTGALEETGTIVTEDQKPTFAPTNEPSTTQQVDPAETFVPQTEGMAATPTEEPTGDGQKGDAPVSDGAALLHWHNKLVMSGSLYRALENDPHGTHSVLAVYRPTTADITSFTYEGKTLSRWAIEADNERILPDRMKALYKHGDDLKLGTALYETGNAEGIKWNKAMYEKMIAYIGEDLLNKYIVDGNFLREQLKQDMDALSTMNVTTPDGTSTVTYNGEDTARTKYAQAYNAYLETVLPQTVERFNANGIACQRAAYRSDGIVFSASADILENLPLDAPEYWSFRLASDDTKDSASDTADVAVVQPGK